MIMRIRKYLSNLFRYCMPQSFLNQTVTSKSDLIEVLHHYNNTGVIDTRELQMIESVFTFSSMRARDIMIPRSQVITIDVDSKPLEYLKIMRDSKHSRYPVIDGNFDNVKGILITKDLLSFVNIHKDNSHLSLNNFLRPSSFVPEGMRLNNLLSHFQSTHNHMAVVVDEYGGVSGIVTIEDVIEQITGDIEDEHDNLLQPNNIKKVGDKLYHVAGLTPITEFNAFFSVSLSVDYFDTIGGLVAQKFGYMPKAGETCYINGLLVRIIHASNKQIKLVEIVVEDALK